MNENWRTVSVFPTDSYPNHVALVNDTLGRAWGDDLKFQVIVEDRSEEFLNGIIYAIDLLSEHISPATWKTAPPWFESKVVS